MAWCWGGEIGVQHWQGRVGGEAGVSAAAPSPLPSPLPAPQPHLPFRLPSPPLSPRTGMYGASWRASLSSTTRRCGAISMSSPRRYCCPLQGEGEGGGGGKCTPLHLATPVPSSSSHPPTGTPRSEPTVSYRAGRPLPWSNAPLLPFPSRYTEVGADGFVPRWEAPAFLSGVLPGLAHAAVLTERWVGV